MIVGRGTRAPHTHDDGSIPTSPSNIPDAPLTSPTNRRSAHKVFSSPIWSIRRVETSASATVATPPTCASRNDGLFRELLAHSRPRDPRQRRRCGFLANRSANPSRRRSLLVCDSIGLASFEWVKKPHSPGAATTRSTHQASNWANVSRICNVDPARQGDGTGRRLGARVMGLVAVGRTNDAE